MRTPALLSLAALLACAAPRPPAPQAPAEQDPQEAAEPAPAPAPPAEAFAPPPAKPGIDPSIVDRSVDPCDDFYAFACNGWIARTEIPPDRSRWVRSFDVVQQQNELRLRAILDRAAGGNVDPEDRYGQQVADLYGGCMNEERIERNGLSDLKSEWRALDGIRDARTLAAAVGRLHRRGVFPLFTLGARQDARDSSQVIGQLSQGGLSLPDRDYYLKEDPASVALRQDFLTHVETELTLAGLGPDRAANEARAVLDLETELARSHWTRAESRDPLRTYNRVDLSGLRKATPAFAWDRYLAAAGAAGTTAFSTTTPAMLSRLDELLGTRPLEAWRAYLRWHVLAEAAAAWALPRALSEEAFWFEAHHFSGEKAMPERWRHCVSVTDSLMGEALGQAFARRSFPPDAREKAEALVVGLEAAMKASLETRAWMDDATRARAEEKLAAVGRKIGYPDAWRSYDGLVIRRADFYGSIRSARAFEERRRLAQIGHPPDRSEWHMTTPQVNAYYSQALNEIVFPAGILQPPFYTLGGNDAVNFGAIGLVVGHELTHGFDDSGRKYDGQGNLTDWWTPAVGEEFVRRAACVERQFSEYVSIDDRKLNGKLTLGENIADLGGLRLSWEAYQSSRQGQPPEAKVAGFTADQQFFLAHAQDWCQIIRPENARLRVVTDPHSPGRWRVNGPLSNLSAFQEAFACKKGDRMVREERCEIW